MDEVWETMNKELEDSIRTAELAVAKIKKLKTKDPKFMNIHEVQNIMSVRTLAKSFL